jgi:hypothetical protein
MEGTNKTVWEIVQMASAQVLNPLSRMPVVKVFVALLLCLFPVPCPLPASPSWAREVTPVRLLRDTRKRNGDGSPYCAKYIHHTRCIRFGAPHGVKYLHDAHNLTFSPSFDDGQTTSFHWPLLCVSPSLCLSQLVSVRFVRA